MWNHRRCVWGEIIDVIKHAKFHLNWFWDFQVASGQEVSLATHGCGFTPSHDTDRLFMRQVTVNYLGM